MVETVRVVVAAGFLTAAVMLGARGFWRAARQSSNLGSHRYKAICYSAGALLFVIGAGLLVRTWISILLLPIALPMIWLEYWLARRQIHRIRG